MKKDDSREKEDEGNGGLLANPDLALQVFKAYFELNYSIFVLDQLAVLGEELTDEPSASLPWHCCSRRSTRCNEFDAI